MTYCNAIILMKILFHMSWLKRQCWHKYLHDHQREDQVSVGWCWVKLLSSISRGKIVFTNLFVIFRPCENCHSTPISHHLYNVRRKNCDKSIRFINIR